MTRFPARPEATIEEPPRFRGPPRCWCSARVDPTTPPGAAEACDAWIAADTAVINYLFTGEGDADSVNAAIDAAISR